MENSFAKNYSFLKLPAMLIFGLVFVAFCLIGRSLVSNSAVGAVGYACICSFFVAALVWMVIIHFRLHELLASTPLPVKRGLQDEPFMKVFQISILISSSFLLAAGSVSKSICVGVGAFICLIFPYLYHEHLCKQISFEWIFVIFLELLELLGLILVIVALCIFVIAPSITNHFNFFLSKLFVLLLLFPAILFVMGSAYGRNFVFAKEQTIIIFGFKKVFKKIVRVSIAFGILVALLAASGLSSGSFYQGLLHGFIWLISSTVIGVIFLSLAYWGIIGMPLPIFSYLQKVRKKVGLLFKNKKAESRFMVFCFILTVLLAISGHYSQIGVLPPALAFPLWALSSVFLIGFLLPG